MKVVFRVDASVLMGIGHLMRCQTLAESLRERGVQVRFICREYPGNLIALLQKNGFQITVLPAPALEDRLLVEDYSVKLGVTQTEDAEQTIEALDGERPDWLVVDHYGLDIEWEQSLRSHVDKIVVIDDLANRHHDCDVLLDQNYSLVGETRYAGLIPKTCKQLLGARYALLRPEYLAHRKTLRARNGQVKRVLVFFGGSDLQNMTGMALEALSHPDMKHLEVDVVVGANNPNRVALEELARVRSQTRIYGPRLCLADLMSQADLAIGAGGTATWERMCLGLPTIVVSLADNQRPASEALAQAQLIQYAGHFTDLNTEHLERLLQNLIQSTAKLAELAMLDRLQVDGLGALRLVEVMSPSAAHELRLRPAGEEDVVCYYNWANDPAVRKNAVNESPIPWATHKAWFASKLQAANSRLFVFEAAGLPIGQIRFDKDEYEACIDYSLDLIVRGRGWGSRLVGMGAALMEQIEPMRLRAEVKPGNDASSAVFLRTGFTETPSAVIAGGRSFYRNPIGMSEMNDECSQTALEVACCPKQSAVSS